MKKLIICGIGETADLASEYFTVDSEYTIIGYAVDKIYKQNDNHNGLPVYDIDTLLEIFNVNEIEVFIAISYTKLNRVRKDLYLKVKKMGYKCASYISSKAFIWRNVKIGDNVFILENNVIQYGAEIGNNVILWSGNHIGHQTKIEDHVYISSQCVVSGFCKIKQYSFLGVNCTLNDNITIENDNIIGSGAVIVKNTNVADVMIGFPAKPGPRNSYKVFKVDNDEI